MGISTRHPPRGSKSGRRPIPAQPDEYSRTAEIIKQNLQIVESNPESPEAMEALQALQAVSPEDMERYLKKTMSVFPNKPPSNDPNHSEGDNHKINYQALFLRKNTPPISKNKLAGSGIS